MALGCCTYLSTGAPLAVLIDLTLATDDSLCGAVHPTVDK
jgi:hypothetical protein